MLKNNQNSQPQSSNPNYLSWFVRDSQDLKRGGTAPIMPSRKSRQTSHNDPFNASQDNDSALNNEENTKNIPVITTSYGNSHPLNQSRGGGTPTGESHRITKVAHPSGVSVYRLTKKKSLTSENNNNSQLPSNAFEALNNGLTSPNQKHDRSRNTPGLPSHEDLSSKDLQDTPLSFMSPGVSSSSFNARPGSSHFKGGSAFRRTRILNESSQNNEEFQTPNTGNLDLESLNNLNNQSTGRDSSPPNLSKQQESRIGVNLRQPMTRQNDPFENELDNIAQLKNFNEARIPQRGPFKGRYGAFGNDDNHDNKAVRVMTADLKTKPKPVIEGRRYAEDVEALNLSDEEDGGFATANSRPSAAKEQNKESLVSIIGRNMQGERETQPKKNERHDDEENIFNRNAQKFTLDFGDSNLDSNLTPHQRGGFVQRPPARKNGQAMNLDDRSMQSEKKPLMMSPGQEQHFERPPSRHKIPTKALGLDLPEEPVKSTPMGILQNHERETPVQKRETVTAAPGRRPHNNLRTGDSDFEFENNDFENLNFNKVLDLSDFLEGDEAPQNQSRSHARPKTTAGAQRDSFQSNQPPKNQGIGIGVGKHFGLQSAKGRPISGLGHNPLLSSKLEAFNNMRNNRSAKDSRLESAYNPSKDNHMKSKLKIKNDHDLDLDNCDVYNMESDSDSFEASLSNRQSFNNTNGIPRNQSGSKLWAQEKGSKKEGLTLGQNMFKDKKSQIVFIHNKGSQSTKKENIDLPFETTLEKDFVGLFAN